MFRQSYQRGMFTIFYSVGSKPLALWDTVTRDGYITRFLDEDIKSTVVEIGGTNVSTTYMTCPKGNAVLGISMPFLIMIVKNLKKYFSFEVTILDATGTRRRFRVSNFQSHTQILPMHTAMPIGLNHGWNQIQFNLSEFTRRAYNKQFVEVQQLKINANIRLRRIYFAERLVPEDQLPAEYKLFFPLKSKLEKPKSKENGKNKENGKENNVLVEPIRKKFGIEGGRQQKSDEYIPKVKGSMQVIKTASQIPEYEERASQMLHVQEDPLERVESAMVVPGLSGELQHVAKDASDHNLQPTRLSTKLSVGKDIRIIETVPNEAVEDQIPIQQEGVESGTTVLSGITEVAEPEQNEVEYIEDAQHEGYTEILEVTEGNIEGPQFAGRNSGTTDHSGITEITEPVPIKVENVEDLTPTGSN